MNESHSIFKQEAEELFKENNSFSYVNGNNGVPEIQGKIILKDEQGLTIDIYDIKIVDTPYYPLYFPLVFETGGRLPVNIDWHVYPDGHCCICSIPNEIMICHKGITLSSFIEQQVVPYFFNQKYRETYGFFLNESSHGALGNIEFFREVFKTDNPLLISKCLMYIKNSPEPGRTENCFCGSGVKYRRCHRDVYRLFKPLSTAVLDNFIQLILRYAQLFSFLQAKNG